MFLKLFIHTIIHTKIKVFLDNHILEIELQKDAIFINKRYGNMFYSNADNNFIPEKGGSDVHMKVVRLNCFHVGYITKKLWKKILQ